MIRYIEEEAIIKAIDESGQRYGITTANRCNFKEIVRKTPTADVVPKSEVEKLREINSLLTEAGQEWQQRYNNAKAEVAREIFEDIENVIDNELQNNYKVLPQFEFSNELWNKMSGRIEALKEICDFIAELKKKYTGDQT